jgi:hypothetical protein
MCKKLRTFLVALLLVPALYSTASAFTTDDGAFKPASPKTNWCWVYWNGMMYAFPC